MNFLPALLPVHRKRLIDLNIQIFLLAIILWIHDSGKAIAQVPNNACQVIMTNGSFEQPDLSITSPTPFQVFQANIKTYNEADVPGWDSSADNFIELWRTGNTINGGVPAYEGLQFAELNAYTNSSLYQDVATTPGSVITWQFAHRGRAGLDTMSLKIGSPGATVAQTNPITGTTSFTTNNTAWSLYQGTYTVPAGQTTTRFEYAAISTAGGNTAVGNFLDAVLFCPLCDFGDAKSNYPVLTSNNGAAHVNDGVTFLGSRLGIELDGQPSAAANGDDGITGDLDRVDDEDGVTFSSVLNAGNTSSVNVVASKSGYLNAWIDFNQDNDWDDLGEKIFTDKILNAGTNNLSFNIPAIANIGNTFARFRFNTTGGLNPTGIAANGEVEDYQIAIASPISRLAGQLVINEVLYAQTGGNTIAGNDEFIELFNASNNSINLSGFKLMDGNLLISSGTDNAGSITGNSSPYVFPNGTILQPGQYAVIWIGNQTAERSASGATFQDWLGKLPKLNDTGDDVWLYDADTKIIDYMAYGLGSAINPRPDPFFNLWNSGYEDSLGVPTLGQSISLTPNGTDGNSSACWEKTVSNNASSRCTGFLNTIDTDIAFISPNQRITSVGKDNNQILRDYGDAPTGYENNNSARYALVTNLHLGNVFPDTETAAQSSVNADGDDAVTAPNLDDEDGVVSTFPTLKTDSTSYSLTATVNNPNGVAAKVYAWIDLDRDGEFDQDERATVVNNNATGTVNLNWDITGSPGANVINGSTYLRIRVTTDNLDKTTETTVRDDASVGAASNGEVEDYSLEIEYSSPNTQSYCESIGGTLNPTNLFTEADNGTFGVGTAENQSSALSPSNLTTYTYQPNYPPPDGQYTVSTRRTQVGFGSWHTLTGHTTGNITDRFMVINANQELENTEMIQSNIVTGLTPHTNYTFTAYIINTVEVNPVGHIDPNVSYGIDLIGVDDDEDGTVDEAKEIEVRYSTGDIPESPQPTWVRYSFLFNTGSATAARFILRNNKLGGFGNDLAIDDITLHGCDLPSGSLQGTLYYDNNGNDNLDAKEAGLPAGKTVRLIDTKGTPQTQDDAIVTRLASSGGGYSFLNIPRSNNYQIIAPSNDGAGNVIGTTNPLTNVSVTAGTTTSNQNFGYDLKSSLLLVKRITAINPDRADKVVFNGFVNDDNDTNDDVAKWPTDKNIYLRGKYDVTDVKPGDEVEYTIYFLSNGSTPAKNVKICDVIPDNMTFVANSYTPNFGMGLALNATALPTEPDKNLSNAIGDDQGDYYPPNTNPAISNLCKKHDPNNPNNLIPLNSSNNLSGAVLINLSDPIPPVTDSGAPTNSYGFIRFRAKVK